MKRLMRIFHFFVVMVIIACNPRNENLASSHISQIKSFIDSKDVLWNWCYTSVTEDQMRNTFNGDLYKVDSLDYIPSLGTYIYGINSFCRDQGAMIILHSKDSNIIIPVSIREFNNILNVSPERREVLNVINNSHNRDMLPLEIFLNKNKLDTSFFEKDEISKIFDAYIAAKHTTSIDTIRARHFLNKQLKDAENILSIFNKQNWDQYGKDVLTFLMSNEYENYFEKRLYMYVVTYSEFTHVFIVQKSAESQFFNDYPYRINYYIF